MNDEYIRDYYMRAVIIITLNNRVNKEKREKKRNNFKLDTCVTWNRKHFVLFSERARNEEKREMK